MQASKTKKSGVFQLFLAVYVIAIITFVLLGCGTQKRSEKSRDVGEVPVESTRDQKQEGLAMFEDVERIRSHTRYTKIEEEGDISIFEDELEDEQ